MALQIRNKEFSTSNNYANTQAPLEGFGDHVQLEFCSWVRGEGGALGVVSTPGFVDGLTGFVRITTEDNGQYVLAPDVWTSFNNAGIPLTKFFDAAVLQDKLGEFWALLIDEKKGPAEKFLEARSLLVF